MNRLDEIKARQDARDRWNEGYGGMRSTDVRTLVAAVEAVLAIHSREADGYGGWMCATCLDDERGFDPEREPWPCDTVTAIREALGEKQ